MTTYHLLTRTADIPPLIDLGRMGHQESLFRHLAFDRNKAEWQLLEFVAEPFNRFACWAADEEGQPAGLFLADISSPIWSNDRIAREIVWYVRPDKRGGLIGPRLLQRYLTWGADQKAKVMLAGSVAGISTKTCMRLLRKFDFDTQGSMALRLNDASV